jgi:hypothetical protein
VKNPVKTTILFLMAYIRFLASAAPTWPREPHFAPALVLSEAGEPELILALAGQ